MTRKIIYFFLFFLGFSIFSIPVFAQNLGMQGEIKTVLNIAKNTDLTMQIGRQIGVSQYNDSMSNFTTISPAKFTISGDTNRNVTITTSNTVNLTSGANTATATVVCRTSNSAMPTTKTEGNDCSSAITTSSSGDLYIAIFPTQVSFSNESATGTYTGTINISVNYN